MDRNMKIADICEIFEKIAPCAFAEDWDNVGLLVGDRTDQASKLMLCIDLTVKVLDEAVKQNADMILAYHPVIFNDLKRMTAQDQPIVYGAVRKGLAVYSMHTALDVVEGGANDVLARAMGLKDTEPLKTLTSKRNKIVVFCPPSDLADIAHAAFHAGGGILGDYSECSFITYGIGTFTSSQSSHPTIGKPGESNATEEARLEIFAPVSLTAGICKAVCDAHSYETPAIDIFQSTDYHADLGMGRVGTFDKPVTLKTLLNRIKKAAGVKKLLLAGAEELDKEISTAACAAGSCGDMWADALKHGAQFYLTGELKHHDALAAVSSGLIVACLGHSNSERMTLVQLTKQLDKKLTGVDVFMSQEDKDPFEIV